MIGAFDDHLVEPDPRYGPREGSDADLFYPPISGQGGEFVWHHPQVPTGGVGETGTARHGVDLRRGFMFGAGAKGTGRVVLDPRAR